MKVALFLVALISPTLALAHSGDEFHGSDMMWGNGWGSMVFGLVITIVVIAAVVVLIVLLVRWLSGLGRDDSGLHVAHRGKAALDILKERYARGEIDKDEFEERRRTLGE